MPYLIIVNNKRTNTTLDNVPFMCVNCVYIEKLSNTFGDIVVFKGTLKSNFTKFTYLDLVCFIPCCQRFIHCVMLIDKTLGKQKTCLKSYPML